MKVRWFLLSVLLSSGAASLFAQATGTTSGDIRGRVHDESGAALSGVAVTATGQETGLVRSDTSAADGSFVLRLLPPGMYRVSATVAGFQAGELSDVRVTIGASANVEFRLRVAAVAETVTVRGEAGLIDPASTEVSKTIGETKIRNLPINQRNFLDFAVTTPGVTVERGPQSGAASTSGLSINGQSPRYNNVVVDGMDNNDEAVGSVRSTFSQEAVQEYQVIQSPFASEYGRMTGGIVNIVTRSGTNELHGSAFYFFRDDSLSDDNFLTGTKTTFEQNQYGASLGGPILRDRLFFFGAAERLDVSDANVVTISDAAVALIRANGFDVTNGEVPFNRDRSTYLLKLDLLAGANHAFAVRGSYSEESDENQQTWGGLVARSGGGVRDLEDTAVALTGTSILSSKLSNELRLLYADRAHRLTPLDESGGVAVTILGVATFGTQRFLPQPRDTQVYQVFDAISFFHGSSAYKFGVDYSHTDFEGSLPLNFAGLYRFGALPPGLPGLPPSGLTALQAFGAGVPQVFAQGFGEPAGNGATNHVGAFGQGEWNVTSRLLLRLGLRYDYEDPIDPFPEDADNWSPRFSFSWDGGRTWRLRGGAGRFYGIASLGPMFAVGIQDGVNVRTIVRTIQGGPSPLVPWRLPNRRFGSAADAGASVVALTVLRPAGCEMAVPPNLDIEGCAEFDSAYTDQANIGFEMALFEKLLFNVDYLHARGKNVFTARNINPITTPPTGRPNPAFSDIYRYGGDGNSWYDGVTAGLQTRIGGPFEASFFYTWADAEDDYVDWLTEFQLQDTLHPEDERGPALNVPEHKATLSAIYTTTAGQYPWWARDWTLALIADYAAGRPFNVLAGFDRNANGDPLSDRPAGVGRNSGELPDYFTVDARVARRIPIGPVGLEAIFEVFNLFNRENVLEVNNVQFANAQLAPNPDFERATRVSDPRRIQLGARLTF
jgi:hypothetical protein